MTLKTGICWTRKIVANQTFYKSCDNVRVIVRTMCADSDIMPSLYQIKKSEKSFWVCDLPLLVGAGSARKWSLKVLEFDFGRGVRTCFLAFYKWPIYLWICVPAEYQAGADADETFLWSVPSSQAAAFLCDDSPHHNHCEYPFNMFFVCFFLLK